MLASLDLLRILLDFGMVVLIWIVQLVIYPGMRYYQAEDLQTWHKKYMLHAPFIIIPLMLGQFVIACIQLFQNQNSYTIISVTVLFILWAQTFYQFAPLHKAINNSKKPQEITLKLVKYNWWRTLLWSLLFIYSFIALGVSG
ncbi:MAG TPA: hypothetical protein ENH91_04380 [Leeuwenhoekiella sp.]|nr:hypothetical protein [Leeuwenhoekiella sp.]